MDTNPKQSINANPDAAALYGDYYNQPDPIEESIRDAKLDLLKRAASNDGCLWIARYPNTFDYIHDKSGEIGNSIEEKLLYCDALDELVSQGRLRKVNDNLFRLTYAAYISQTKGLR